jgi:hypothetical protein
MTTQEFHQQLAQGRRSYQVTGYSQHGRLNSQTKLTYRQARWIAAEANAAGSTVTYVVEAHAATKRMDAMPVAA